MEHDELKAEIIALQTLMIGLLKTFSHTPAGSVVINEAFRYAETVSEAAVVQIGDESTARYVTRIAEVLEQLRAAVMKDTGEPKGGV